jgi:APA family basic amino acid/polyamine antiporter
MASAPTTPTRGQLLRVLGVTFGIAVTVGNTIGAGILRSGTEIAGYLPTRFWFIAIWFIGGGLAMLAALSFAELGVMIPRSGGHYPFAHDALGDYAGFVIGWSDWLSTAGSASAVSIVIGEYSGLLFPSLAGKEVWVGSSVVVAFALLQWRGIRIGSSTQNISSLIKTIAYAVLIIAAFFFAGTVADHAAPAAMPAGLGFMTAFILALQAAIYAYDGWAGVIYFTEETKNPVHDVPRSMFGGTIAVIVIYVLFSWATMHVLPISAISADKLPMGTIAKLVWGAHGDTIIQVVTIVTMLSAINAFNLMGCRIIYSMSVDGLFPRVAQHVNPGGTPDAALLLTTVVAVYFIVSQKTFQHVSAIMAFFFASNYILGLISVFVLRRRDPDRRRHFRAIGYPWTTGFALIAYSAFLIGAVYSDRRNSFYALLLLAASYPLFRWMKFMHGRAAKS